jgi:2,4-dienoyl-CoA reductase-like NADH-dependent reductase (Old Yellow Enzyme family)
MPQLFSPFRLGHLTLRNRLAVSPMCQYSALMGMAQDYHFVHLGRFALGGFGLVIVEATAVSPEGRITYGDLGLWNDAQIGPLKRIVEFLQSQGTAAGIQIAHAGRKASTPPWWRGSFNETEEEKQRFGFESWTPLAPSAVPHSAANPLPTALDEAGLDKIVADFAATTERAALVGFDLLQLHSAHGYLLHQFLSPVANRRSDAYGGSLENRMRLPLRVAQAVRERWPAERPLMARISMRDWIEGGWHDEEAVVYARALKALGYDLIDCSSGGFDGAAVKAGPGYQVPFAERVRREAGIATMAVGLISTPEEAEAVIAGGKADMVALGRTALDDPNWPAHARRHLKGDGDAYDHWNKQAGFAVKIRDRLLQPASTG